MRKPYLAIITKVYDKNGDGGEDLNDVKALFESGENKITELKGDGDFRSKECIDLLKQSDIVVTNPPFSLFREYVAQLVKHGKQFVILGNKNSITYKEIFPLIAQNKLWLGVTPIGKDMLFKVSKDYASFLVSNKKQGSSYRIDKGEIKARAQSCWFTNLDHKKRHEELILWKEYTPEEYPKYDNYDAIEVSKTAEIPKDYAGVMGVPITFLDKYNPEQFEVIWTTDRGGDGQLDKIKRPHERYDAPVINGRGIYKRILIKLKH